MSSSTFKVIYIAGNGHSGSTLLDIILGSSQDAFSAGELTFITRDTIFEEYCSCHTKIKECNFWSEVIKLWQNNSEIDLDEYKKLRHKFERNKTTFRVLLNSLFPSNDFKLYCQSTYQLFKVIHEQSGKSIIIDSSKSPQRILVLKKHMDLKVIHLCRNVKGVLNSSKKVSKKDIKAGIEEDNFSRRTSKTLIEWCFVNFITEFLCLGVNSQKVKYNSYVKNPGILNQISKDLNLNKFSGLSPKHMIAGNKIRLQKALDIQPHIGSEFKNINQKQKRIASIFEFLFPYWC